MCRHLINVSWDGVLYVFHFLFCFLAPYFRFSSFLSQSSPLSLSSLLCFLPLVPPVIYSLSLLSPRCLSFPLISLPSPHRHDCDFNQALDIELNNKRTTIWDLQSFDVLAGKKIATQSHCFGCKKLLFCYCCYYVVVMHIVSYCCLHCNVNYCRCC